MKAFFMVFSPTGIYAPTCRHETRALAKAEAERLAKSCPGQEFFVFAALSRSCTPPLTENLEGAPGDDDIPF